MSLTNTQIHDLITQCDYYKDSKRLNKYYRPLSQLHTGRNDDTPCLTLESHTNINQPKFQIDALRNIYSPKNFMRGESIKYDGLYEPFSKNKDYINPVWLMFIFIFVLVIVMFLQ
jgi:hypothetical protein